MRLSLSAPWLLLILLICSDASAAVLTQALPATVTVTIAPSPQATFSWPAQPADGWVMISRRILGEIGDSTWVKRDTVKAPGTTYVDTGLAVGVRYEYRVTNSAWDTCYLVVTTNAPLEDARGAVLLVVDSTISSELAGELRQLEMDMVGDGWQVVRMDSPRHGAGTPEALKAAIIAAKAKTPAINSMLLYGKLPMVRSGLTAPDGHAPSRAHETDTFYADLDGQWTDTTVNVPYGGDDENENIPGDGKYDQNEYPTALELATGRVTFHGMYNFRKTEREYLRDYIHKDHAWRQSLRSVPYRAYFSDANTSGYYLFSARSWMTPMFGSANVTRVTSLQPGIATNPHIWAYSNDYLDPGKQAQAIFTATFKSWKQHWWRDNNAIRSLMTQPDWGLTGCWGGRPSWFFHHMAAGRTVGYSALRTQNSRMSGPGGTKGFREYGPSEYDGYESYVHNNFLGDPTLRMHPLPPPGPVAIVKSGTTATLSWSASAATGLVGYHVYRSAARLGPYTRLTSAPITATAYVNSSVPSGAQWYQVRAVAKTTVPTGTFFNQSQAQFGLLNADGSYNRRPIATAGSLTVKSNTPGWFAFKGSDPDGDALTPIVLSNPQNGQLRWTLGQPFYISNADFVGTDSFVFAMSDGIHTSAPATITVAVNTTGNTLLAWEVPDVSGTPATDATFVASHMQSSAIGFGSGSPRSNPHPYLDQVLIRSLNVATLNTGKYLRWVSAPAAGYRQSLSRTSFSLMSSTGSTIHGELRVSTDGFATWSTVPLLGGVSSGSKGLRTADLSQVAALQNTTAAAEFRLHLWLPTAADGNAAAGFGKSGDKPVDKIEDLVVQGTVQPTGGGVVNRSPVIANADPASLNILEDATGSLVLNATDADGNPLTWSVLTQGTKGTAAASGTGTSRTVTYTPSANANGADSFVIRVADGQGGSDQITVQVTITPVNDVPSFTKGSNQTVLENAGARTVSGWATALSKGPADEAGQTLNFIVSNSNNALFSVPPTVSPAGVLTYTPAANANGSATVSVRVQDNGGIANGGVDTSAVQTCTITVTPANVAGGWQGTYYDNQDFTGTRVQRTDAEIAFAWPSGTRPHASIAATSFSVRWRAQVTAPATGTWTFTATTDDGVRVWVGGRKIIDRWVNQGPTEVSGSASLTAGVASEVVMEYYQGSSGAVARLDWAGPGQARQPVPASATVPATGDDLPGGWSAADIGAVARAGAVAESGGTWTVTGSGSDIWNTADEGCMVSQKATGDMQITARIVSLTNTNAWAKAGVMIRASGAAGAKHAFVCATPSNGISFQRRLATSGVSSSTAGPKSPAPYWLRVERVGDVLIGSSSADGTAWTEIRRVTIAMGDTVLVGLAVSAHQDGAACTATFTNVEIITAPTPAN